MKKLTLFVSAAAMAALSGPALAQDDFADWRDRFERDARARGYDEALVGSLFVPEMAADQTSVRLSQSQPEFIRPVWEYLDSAVSERRISDGLSNMARNEELFEAIEQRYGVSKYIVAAIWGLESAYGEVQGDHDVPGTLATLGWSGWRPDFVRGELFAVLDMLADGEARREQLTGSWAGAMGQTQFMPSSYRRHAQDWNGDGLKNIWSDEGDALASAAAYLEAAGWRAGAPSVIEVDLPDDFDWSTAEQQKTVREWLMSGVRRAGDMPFGEADPDRTARLLTPVGAAGPAFLQFPNFRTIMAYNNSTSYALAVSLLADALAGRPGLVGEWPRTEPRMSMADAEQLQALLTAAGYDTQGVDGVIGPNTRSAIRAYQTDKGLTADGAVSAALLAGLRAEAGG